MDVFDPKRRGLWRRGIRTEGVGPDPERPEDDDRSVLLGPSIKLRLLLAVHAYPGEDEILRDGSARRVGRFQCDEGTRSPCRLTTLGV